MIVALRTAYGQTQKDRTGRVDAINNRFIAKLLDVDTPFLVDLRIALKAGGDLVVERGIGFQMTSYLVGNELVEGHVPVQAGDDPVAVFPDGPGRVNIEAVGVGIASLVEPEPSPAFAMVS